MKDTRTTGITAYCVFSAADIKEMMSTRPEGKTRVLAGFGYIQLAEFPATKYINTHKIEEPLKYLYDFNIIGVYERDGGINAVAIREPKTKAEDCRPQCFLFCWLGDLHRKQDGGESLGLISHFDIPHYITETKFLGICAGFAVLQITAYNHQLLPHKQSLDVNVGYTFLYACEQKAKEPF